MKNGIKKTELIFIALPIIVITAVLVFFKVIPAEHWYTLAGVGISYIFGRSIVKAVQIKNNGGSS